MRSKPWLIGSVALLAAAAIYFYLRPEWVTATEAEVRAEIDPVLLTPVPSQVASEDRYRRMLEPLKAIRTVGYHYLQPSAPPRARTEPDRFKHQEGHRVDRLRSVLNEGPYSVSYPQSWHERDTIRNRVRGLGVEGSLCVRAGRATEGSDLLLLSLLLARRQAESMNPDTLPLDDLANVATAYGYIADCVRLLSEPELKRIEKEIPKDRENVQDFQRAVRTYFQRKILPVLADPKAWAAKAAPGLPPEESLVPLAKLPDRDRSQVVVDRYDAFATARDASRFFAAITHNAALAPPQRTGTEKIIFMDLANSLPRSTVSGHRGWNRKARLLWDRMAMRRVSNAFGKQFLHRHFVDLVFATNLVDVRQIHADAIRTLIALRRYRLRHGVAAPSLEALVKNGLLSAIPYDPLGKASISYSHATHALWSVGFDGHDNGGHRVNDIAFATP